jgi:hypothetical protein
MPTGAFPTIEPLAERFAPELRPWRLGATLFSAVGVLALLVATIARTAWLVIWFSSADTKSGFAWHSVRAPTTSRDSS